MLLRANSVRGGLGMEDRRVTLHGVSWAVCTVAPACIDLDRKKQEEEREKICHHSSPSVPRHRSLTLTLDCLLMIVQLLNEQMHHREGSGVCLHICAQIPALQHMHLLMFYEDTEPEFETPKLT